MNPGDVLGAYQLDARLGAGAFGEVWSATHTVLHGRHAIKVLDGSLAASPAWRERFVAEGRILAQLRHPHVVRVTDVLLDGDRAALVMDLVEGRPLADWLQDGPLPDRAVLDVMRGMLEGLQAVHEVGVVHRDLKPDNLLVSEEGARLRPVLVDFGIAKVMRETGITGDRSRTTRHGLTMGTPQYMSPEQIESTADVDVRTDVFAAGAMLYEMLTGAPAFDGQGQTEILYRITRGEHGTLAALSPAMQTLITRCLAVDPAQRPASAAALLASLDNAARQGPFRATAPGPGPVIPTARPVQPAAMTAAPPTELPMEGPSGSGPSVLVGVAGVLLLAAGGALAWAAGLVGAEPTPQDDDPAPAEASVGSEVPEAPVPSEAPAAVEPEPEPEPEAPSDETPAQPSTPAPSAPVRTPKPTPTRPPDGARVEAAWDALSSKARACVPGGLWAVQLSVAPSGRAQEITPQHLDGTASPDGAACLRSVAERLSVGSLDATVRRRFRVDAR